WSRRSALTWLRARRQTRCGDAVATTRREKVMMRVVHFTEGATDPLHGFRAHGVKFVPLADGAGHNETHVSCFHFEPGGWISDPPVLRDAAIFVVRGAVTVMGRKPKIRLDLSPGVGIVVDADARYRVESDGGAVLMLVEAERLEATDLGMSCRVRSGSGGRFGRGNGCSWGDGRCWGGCCRCIGGGGGGARWSSPGWGGRGRRRGWRRRRLARVRREWARGG